MTNKELIEKVADLIGVGTGDWDMVDPEELAGAFREVLGIPVDEKPDYETLRPDLTGAQGDVALFHRTFDITTHYVPTMPNEKNRELRANLIEEEAREFRDAADAADFIGKVDAAVDIIYVALGALLALGVDATPIWREVQRSNMSKIGGYKNEYGKWVKPPNYSPADIEGKVFEQIIEAGLTDLQHQPEEELA